jgi:hypothetical protein
MLMVTAQRKAAIRDMRIFENREDAALRLDREEQEPLPREPHDHIISWDVGLLTPAQKAALPLENFPLIEDFEVILLPFPAWRRREGYHLAFFSQQQGLLTSFGFWGHAYLDYTDENFCIPLMNFWDREQAWEQIIFEKDGYVYVLEGDFDDHTVGYYCWFRVRKERYLAEWQAALEVCRQIMR